MTNLNGCFKENLKLQQSEIDDHEMFLKSKPTQMAILFGNKCNINCKMCGNKGFFTRNGIRKTTQLGECTIKDIISYLPYLKNIIFSGGEPLVYKEFGKVVEIAKEYPNAKLKVMTNGNLMNDSWVNTFCETPFRIVAISLDAATEKTYRNIRVKGDFKKVLAAIKNINDMKNGGAPEVQLSYVIMRRNINEIIDFIELAHKYNVSTIAFQTIKKQKSLFYSMENVLRSKKNCFDLMKFCEKAKDLTDDYGIKLVNRIPPEILCKKPNFFFEYYKIKENDLNTNNGFSCSRYWERLDVAPNFFTTCVFSIPNPWDPIYTKSDNKSVSPTIKDVWNCGRIRKARKLIDNGKHTKVCRFDCPKYFNHITKQLI